MTADNFRGNVSTHSRPKAAAKEVAMRAEINQFQHTAARRRLPLSATLAASR